MASIRDSAFHACAHYRTDTTAMTLNAALGYMGLNEDFQQEMYQEVMSVMPTEEDFVSRHSEWERLGRFIDHIFLQTFAKSSQLQKVQACFLEAARIFRVHFPNVRHNSFLTYILGPSAAGYMWIRDSAEDIILQYVGPNRDQQVVIPAGTRFVVDAIGLRQSRLLVRRTRTTP